MKRIFCLIFSILLFLPQLRVNALSVSAKGAVVINGDTGEVIYSQNADARLPMASTTKIMTALLLCEYGNLDREITVTKEMVAVEGSSMGLLPDDKVSLRGLLYGMLLASGNDAANTTAIVVGGSIENFVKMMNQKAKELGLENTSFETPSGLDGENHYTTAYELALLAKAALQNEDFAAAATTRRETLYYGNPPYRRSLTNHNKLLDSYDGLIGVKTGFTKKSGRCLVTAAKRNGEYVIAVTLNAPDDWNNHRAMLDYGFEMVEVQELSPQKNYCLSTAYGDISVEALSNAVTLSGSSADSVGCRIVLPQFLYLPIKKGEVIGSAEYFLNGKIIARENICTQQDVVIPENDYKLRFKAIFKYILSFI